MRNIRNMCDTYALTSPISAFVIMVRWGVEDGPHHSHFLSKRKTLNSELNLMILLLSSVQVEL